MFANYSRFSVFDLFRVPSISGGDPLASIFNRATHHYPLLTSLAPGKGSDALSYVRATTATIQAYPSSAGPGDSQLIIPVAAGEARFGGARRVSEGVWNGTYSDGSKIPDDVLKGYLSEGSRTNLLTYSEAFDNAAWTKSFFSPVSTVLSNGVGGTTIPDSSYQNFAVYNETHATWITNITPWTTTNGRVTDIVVAPAGCIRIRIYPVRSDATHYAHQPFTVVPGNTYTLSFFVDGLKVGGVQAELGAFPSSYIPTTTATVTRNADALSLPATAINNASGAVYFEVEKPFWSIAAGQFLGDGTRALLKAATSTSGIQAFDGTNTASGPAGTPSGRIKAALRWDATTGKMRLAANGALGAEANYDGSWNLSSLLIGSGENFYGRNLRIWDVALTDSELQVITK